MSAGVITDIPLFRGAEPELLARFAARVSFGVYEPDALVVDFDDVTSDVFFIVQGALRALVRTPGGREVILGDFGAGDIFGEMAAIDASPRSASISALNRSVVARMGATAFMELGTTSPIVARRLMQVLTARIRTGNARLVEHSALTIRYRLYAELLREAKPRRTGAGLIISPPPVQSTLAARIGARREAVSREIAQLLRDKVLERTPGGLVILLPDALREAVERELQD
jgi:CRP-like cAMP-binding protein